MIDYYKDQEIEHNSVDKKYMTEKCKNKLLKYIGIKKYEINRFDYVCIAYECKECGYFPLRVLKFCNGSLIENKWYG